MKKKYYLLLLCVFTVLAGQAQQVREDLIRINQAYKDMPQWNIEVVYRAQEGNTPAAEEDIQKGVIVKSKNYLYHRMGKMETLVQDSLRMIVDHDRKVMVLAPGKTDSIPANVPAAQIEAALKKCTRVIALKKNQVKGYELWMDKEGKEKVSFTYHPGTYLIDRFEFFYSKIMLNGVEKENLRLEVTYKYPDAASAETKTIGEFVTMVNGAFVSGERYRSYQLIDYTALQGNAGK